MDFNNEQNSQASQPSPDRPRIVDYSETYKDAVILLLCKGRSPRFKEWKRSIWNWEFRDNPNLNPAYSPIMAVDADKIIGFYGTLPVKIKYNDRKITAVWGCDFFVDPQYRRKGYGQSILRALTEKSPIILGLGISDHAIPTLKRHGRKINTEIVSFTCQNKIHSFRDSVKSGIHHFKRIKNLAHHISTKDLNSEIIDAIYAPVAIDALWSQVENGYSKIIIRDHAYIKWRYGDFPIEKYQLITVTRDGKLAGVGVFRKHPKESKLVDYVGPARDLPVKYFIVRTFVKECSDSISLNCICTDKEFKTCLEYHGFIRSRDKPKFSVFSKITGDPEPEKDWFVMGGDSDYDLIAAADDIHDF